MRNIVIFGASRGLGHALTEGLGADQDRFFLVSRSEPVSLKVRTSFSKQWIQADLSDTLSVPTIIETIGDSPIDVLVYNAGIWEEKSFESTPQDEILRIINTNLTSAILLVQQLLPNLRTGNLKKIIFIGSTCGLENEGNDAVVYTATKFGLRGATHALREFLRKDGISVACISPGSIATDIPFGEGAGAALQKYMGARMPVADIVNIVNLILNMSNATCIKEIHVPALQDTDV